MPWRMPGYIMRTFKLELAIDLKVIVPDEWVAQYREQAQAPDVSEFLLHADRDNPDDEDFALHLLKHGVRRHVRQSLLDLFFESKMGCTLSPARAKVIDRSPPHGEPVLASVINT